MYTPNKSVIQTLEGFVKLIFNSYDMFQLIRCMIILKVESSLKSMLYHQQLQKIVVFSKPMPY